MIHLLSREFGIPFNFGDLLADTEPSPSKKLVISEWEDKWYSKHLLRSSLDNNNEAYILWKWEMERQEIKDHIKVGADPLVKFLSLNILVMLVVFCPGCCRYSGNISGIT